LDEKFLFKFRLLGGLAFYLKDLEAYLISRLSLLEPSDFKSLKISWLEIELDLFKEVLPYPCRGVSFDSSTFSKNIL